MDLESFYRIPSREGLLQARERLLGNLREIRDKLIEIDKKLGIESKIKTKKFCLQCKFPGDAHIYYGDKIHYLNGNRFNELHSNKAVVCPCCGAHIVLSALAPGDIWELKEKGMSNAAIARKLGVSRQRVGTLLKAYRPPTGPTNEVDLDELIKEIQSQEREATKTGRQWADEDLFTGTSRKPPTVLKERVTDRRTLRKKLLKEMKKQGIKPKGGTK